MKFDQNFKKKQKISKAMAKNSITSKKLGKFDCGLCYFSFYDVEYVAFLNCTLRRRLLQANCAVNFFSVELCTDKVHY